MSRASEIRSANKSSLHDQMQAYGSIDFARRSARHLSGAALHEAATAFDGIADTPQKKFIFDMVFYVVNRDR